MKKSICITYVLALLLVWPLLGVQAEVDGPTVLRRMLDAEGRVPFRAHEVTSITCGRTVTSEQKIVKSGFRGMRIEYLSPPAMRGEVLLDDGSQLIHYVPNKRTATAKPSRLSSLKSRSDMATRALKSGTLQVQLIGTDRIAGRRAHIITVTPKLRHDGPKRKFWVDAEKWIKLKTEDQARDGSVASVSYYTKVEFVNSVPDSTFKFVPPKGVRVESVSPSRTRMTIDEARKQAGFKVLEPGYLPPGFKPVGATVSPFRDGKIVALRYSDGVSSFSLFQTPDRVLSPGFLRRLHKGPSRPRTGVYSWKVGDLNLTIVGGISEDQIERIANSVR